ncbi:MAG: S-methyl-5'-thioadenosine phosphorylase [Anaerolineales bacterium]|nr:MAG: S-methyl-5'-thioadenosine phosphorylase [Anaerolineales bacterium]
MNDKPRIAVIGGSGLYTMEGFKVLDSHQPNTPFGKPSSPILLGELAGRPVAFLTRHGIGHTIAPSQVNYRANIYALKTLGVERILSVSACGSLREDYAPGEIVIPNQLYDHTTNRARSFFDGDLVAHISVAEPFCEDLSNHVQASIEAVEGRVHRGGSYITIEGPRFSTRAEANTYRAWGMSIVGMTTSPEAFLAREAEMCYSVMAHVTDYDVWHHSEDPVTAEMVFDLIKRNTTLAQQAVWNLLESLPEERNCSCPQALKAALLTHPEHVSKETRERLAPLVGRYLG